MHQELASWLGLGVALLWRTPIIPLSRHSQHFQYNTENHLRFVNTPAAMIINNHGQARMLKFYEYLSEDTQQKALKSVYSTLSKRPDTVCNFLEGASIGIWGSDTKLVYRHYATLYFVFVVDQAESELGVLDLIQVFVETLDRCFEHVAELDIIFHSTKVHHILDEIVLGGMVAETNMQEILSGVWEANRLDRAAAPKTEKARLQQRK